MNPMRFFESSWSVRLWTLAGVRLLVMPARAIGQEAVAQQGITLDYAFELRGRC